MRTIHVLFVVGAILSSTASMAAAQPASSGSGRVVVWAGPFLSSPVTGGVLESDYSPVLEAASDYSSSARQTLHIDRGTGKGIEGGADLFFSRHAGIRFGLSHSKATISGPGNSDYQTFLRYTGMQPPDYVRREYTTDASQVWPDTTGTVSATSVLMGAVAGLNRGGTVDADLSAGVSVTRLNARVESLGYTTYRLGGHSVLFDFQQRVIVSTSGAAAVVRPYLEGHVSLRLNARLSVMAGLRAEVGGAASLQAHPDSFVDPDEASITTDLLEVQRILALGPVDLPTPRWHLVLGLRWRVR